MLALQRADDPLDMRIPAGTFMCVVNTTADTASLTVVWRFSLLQNRYRHSMTAAVRHQRMTIIVKFYYRGALPRQYRNGKDTWVTGGTGVSVASV